MVYGACSAKMDPASTYANVNTIYISRQSTSNRLINFLIN